MKAYREFLFWFHVVLILVSVFTALFLPLWFFITVLILHEIHVRIFHGCALTQYEIKLHGIPKNADFFQYLIQRLVGVRVSKTAGRVVNYSILFFALGLAILRNV